MRKRPVVAVLERHYSRIRGELQGIAEEVVHAGVAGPELAARRAPEVAERRALLASVDACLRLVEPDWTPDHIQPRRTRRPPELEWSELLHMAYGVLQPASVPLSSPQIIDLLWRQNKLTEEQAKDPRYRAALTKRLRGEEVRGAVRAVGQNPATWKVRERGDPRSAPPRRIGTQR